MADDPWARYRQNAPQTAPQAPASVTTAAPDAPAASSDDPWARFRGGSTSAPAASAAAPSATSSAVPPASAPASSYDPSWKPSGNAFMDFLTMPRAKTEDVIPAAMDTGLSLLDASTFGYGPQWLGAQKQAAQAHANLGIMDPLVQGIGYAVGPGKVLGPLARGTVGMAAPALTEAGAPLAARIGGQRRKPRGGLEGAAAGGKHRAQPGMAAISARALAWAPSLGPLAARWAVRGQCQRRPRPARLSRSRRGACTPGRPPPMRRSTRPISTTTAMRSIRRSRSFAAVRDPQGQGARSWHPAGGQ